MQRARLDQQLVALSKIKGSQAGDPQVERDVGHLFAIDPVDRRDDGGGVIRRQRRAVFDHPFARAPELREITQARRQSLFHVQMHSVRRHSVRITSHIGKFPLAQHPIALAMTPPCQFYYSRDRPGEV